MRLFGVIEGPAEVVALRAKLIALGPEASGLVSHRLLALGECRPQPLSLVERVLSVDAQPMVVGAGRLEPVFALFEQPGEPVDLCEGGVEIGVPPVELVSRAIVCRLLVAQKLDFACEPSDLGPERFPFFRQRSHLRGREFTELSADPFQAGRGTVELFAQPVVRGLGPVVRRPKLQILGRKLVMCVFETLQFRFELRFSGFELLLSGFKLLVLSPKLGSCASDTCQVSFELLLSGFKLLVLG
jgi:hypothetical protein